MYAPALVGLERSIDWFCFLHFDSPSLFATIFDDKKGGGFQITPAGGDVIRQELYWPNNMAVASSLETRRTGELYPRWRKPSTTTELSTFDIALPLSLPPRPPSD